MRISDLFEARIPEQSRIERMLTTYFKFSGKYSIRGNIIDVDGSCALQKKNNRSFDKLPLSSSDYNLKFGTINGDMTYPPNIIFSLEGGPEVVKGRFVCSVNQLTSLKGGPDSVGKDYLAHNNPLTSLEGCPIYVGGKITIPYIENLPMLRLLFINGVNSIELGYEGFRDQDVARQLMKILNKYLRTGRKGALQCAAEMTKAGYKGNARL